MIITRTFREVKEEWLVKGICPVCGKKGQRKYEVSNTINPWNKNADGSVKDYQQVLKDVMLEANIKKDGQIFLHAKCESVYKSMQLKKCEVEE